MKEDKELQELKVRYQKLCNALESKLDEINELTEKLKVNTDFSNFNSVVKKIVCKEITDNLYIEEESDPYDYSNSYYLKYKDKLLGDYITIRS